MTRLFIFAIVFAMLLLPAPSSAIAPGGTFDPHWSEENPPSKEGMLFGYIVCAIAGGIYLTFLSIIKIIRWMWDRFYDREISSPPGRPKPPWHRRFMYQNLALAKLLPKVAWRLGQIGSAIGGWQTIRDTFFSRRLRPAQA